MSTYSKPRRSRQSGGAVVEFALVLSVYLLLLFGIIEMGRAMFTYNSAAEATRRGARLAVVTKPADFNTVVIPSMQAIMPSLKPENVAIRYSPAGCTTDCEYLELGIVNYTMTVFFWPASAIRFPGTDANPGFKTTLPVESLGDN